MGKHFTDEEVMNLVPKIGSITPAQLNARFGTRTLGTRLKSLAKQGKLTCQIGYAQQHHYSRVQEPENDKNCSQ
jgi:hypothetical protein